MQAYSIKIGNRPAVVNSLLTKVQRRNYYYLMGTAVSFKGLIINYWFRTTVKSAYSGYCFISLWLFILHLHYLAKAFIQGDLNELL